jgi:hypothetical protein
MPRIILVAALGGLVMASPGWAQDQDPGLALRGGEIVIPSERTLEREVVTQPRNEFSTDDATAIRQIEEQNRLIDREVMRGICTGC